MTFHSQNPPKSYISTILMPVLYQKELLFSESLYGQTAPCQNPKGDIGAV